MDRIVGILPAGGKARRIHGFFKEMMPIGIKESDKSKFIVSSEQIIRSILDGGAASVHFLLNAPKSFIAEYYARQELFTGRINFNYITAEIEEFGMPYALDNIFEQTKDYDYVLMGLPDTVIEPANSFRAVFKLLRHLEADVALGIYRTDNRNRGGYIIFDRETKEVKRHIDKTSPAFPQDADNSWAIVCWNLKFTEYLHTLLNNKRNHRSRNPAISHRELLFGDVIDEAIMDSSVRVVADFVDEKNGFYWDITEPEKYFDLLRRYYSSGDASIIKEQSLNSKKIFIGHGHSDCWKDLREFLHDRLGLQWEEFNRLPVAGKSTLERLREMVEGVGFAFLVMTAEEEDKLGNLRARDNVIHEVGLFQGRLGFERAVILLEDGCEEFSNITGLIQIRFPKGNLMASSEEIRRVLEREGLVDQEVGKKRD